jgi:hypothetical protein
VSDSGRTGDDGREVDGREVDERDDSGRDDDGEVGGVSGRGPEAVDTEPDSADQARLDRDSPNTATSTNTDPSVTVSSVAARPSGRR